METRSPPRCRRRRRDPGLPRRQSAVGNHFRSMTPQMPMTNVRSPLDLKRLKVYPLAERDSESRLEEILVAPSSPPRPCPEAVTQAIHDCAQLIKAALKRKASVLLIYGAHLIK